MVAVYMFGVLAYNAWKLRGEKIRSAFYTKLNAVNILGLDLE
jgi:hypothetical protein